MIKFKRLSLFLILLLGFILRLYGINWDSGFHLHPDERMILMVTDRIHFFDKLNPHFFNYGSLPIYLLKGASRLLDFLFNAQLANYKGMLYVGRTFSIIFDVLTTLLIYKIVLILPIVNGRYRWVMALFSSFFYAIAFFPIQNSHFFTVDILFTFLTTALIYILTILVRSHQNGNPPIKYILIIAFVFAALFATKFTAIVFLPIILLILVIKNKFSPLSILHSLFFILYFLFFSFIFMPYAFLDFSQFARDISLQLTMNRNAYIFPYTLQYVNTMSYWYYLKNIFLWGLGPFISILSLVGIVKFVLLLREKFTFIHQYQKSKIKYQIYKSNSKYLIFNFNMYLLFFIFYFFYFLVIGASAVKFMRYMLPIYPFFAIMAGFGLSNIFVRSDKIIGYVIKLSLSSFVIVWTLMFINIYSQPNTRITASDWILKNIPAGSTLAVEYWDDYLPTYDGGRYRFNELHLYDLPDDSQKWDRLDKQLQKSDYIIIASNRLYTPLQKLSDCAKYKVCYPKTAEYYQKLFNNKLSFKKIAEFSVYPQLSIGNYQLTINDQSADESFTVFDHPKVMIFRKT